MSPSFIASELGSLAAGGEAKLVRESPLKLMKTVVMPQLSGHGLSNYRESMHISLSISVTSRIKVGVILKYFICIWPNLP